MADEDPQYEVGYGKPPKSGQFPQGRSGNRNGRPKGSRNLASTVLRETREKVLVRGPRGSRKVTKLEAAVMQLGNKAAQGDPRAQREPDLTCAKPERPCIRSETRSRHMKRSVKLSASTTFKANFSRTQHPVRVG